VIFPARSRGKFKRIADHTDGSAGGPLSILLICASMGQKIMSRILSAGSEAHRLLGIDADQPIQ